MQLQPLFSYYLCSADTWGGEGEARDQQAIFYMKGANVKSSQIMLATHTLEFNLQLLCF